MTNHKIKFKTTSQMAALEIPNMYLQNLLSFFPRGVIVFDLETTGLNAYSDKIIEIGAVKLDPQGKIHTFNELINPQVSIPHETIKIHQITDQMVQNSPVAKEVLPKFVEFCEQLPLFAHNAQFDIGFLIYQLHLDNIDFNSNKVYCSLKLARALTLAITNYKLPTLAKYFEIEISNSHRALDDSLSCFNILCRILNLKAQSKKADQFIAKSFMYELKKLQKKENYIIKQKLVPLLDMTKDQKIVEIDYQSTSQSTKMYGTKRFVKVISFLPMPQGLVLHGQCLRTGGHKSFNLKKIKNFRLPDENEQSKLEELALELDTKHRTEQKLSQNKRQAVE